MTEFADDPHAVQMAREDVAQQLKDGGVPREEWLGYIEAADRLTTVAEIEEMVDTAISEH